MQTMISPDEARQIALEMAAPLPTETINHEQSLHRTLAADIISPLDLPPFDNSSMDGYALLAADVAMASENDPVVLDVLQTIGAGEVATQVVAACSCIKIMTGAPIPSGADAVVMHEETVALDNARVAIQVGAQVGQNIRRRGSDVARGEKVLSGGTSIRAAEWAMLAALGCERMEVFRRPRVAIITTGEELVDVGTRLSNGQIHDSNSFALEALCREAGADIVARRRIGDDQSTLMAALRDLAPQCDLMVSSGGVSAGDFDPVRDVLQAHARVHFWKIAMKPGKPVMFASFEHNDHAVPIWGLPGNPVSVMVAFELFVRPMLLQMQGRSALNRVQVAAIIDSDLRSPFGRTEYVRARVVPTSDGWQAILSGDQGSGRLSTMTRANALLEVPPETTFVAAGETLSAIMTDWPEII